MDVYEAKRKEQKEILGLLKNNETLSGKALEIALSIVEFNGDEDVCKLYRNIEAKLKEGQSLSEYEIYLMDDRFLSMDFEEKRTAYRENTRASA